MTCDEYPYLKVLNYSLQDFKVYVSDKEYFLACLPPIHITSSARQSSWHEGISYFEVILAIYCATFSCGVNLEHLTPFPDVNHVITSIMQFHVYFTMRSLLTRLKGGKKMSTISKEFGAGEIYGHNYRVPWDFIYQGYKDSRGIIGEHNIRVLNKDYKSNYKKYVPIKSTGFTTIGPKYVQESIEAYVYCVLGLQANTLVNCRQTS